MNESPTKPEKAKSPLEKAIDFLEIASLCLLAISFGSLLVVFIWDRYFAPLGADLVNNDLFLTPILCMFPIGVFALLVQLLAVVRKRPSSCLRKLILAAAIVALPLGLFLGFAYTQSQH